MKLPQQFLKHWLHAFEKSRIDNYQMVTNFISKLESTLPYSAQPAQDSHLGYKMGRGWRSSPDSHRSLWQIFRLACHERDYLKKGLSHPENISMWLVADDRRTGVIKDWKTLSDQLKIFGSSTPAPWLEKWKLENPKLICFTPNLTALQPEGDHSTVYLSYVSLLAVPLAWPVAFIFAACRMLFNQPLAALLRGNFWITSLIAASFDVIYSRQIPRRLLMITSNSYVIELLRYIVIGASEGEGVIEVLHGIPSLEVEEYHREMISFDPGLLSGRLTLIPPVSNLELDSAGGAIRVLTDVINLKINSAIHQIDLSSLAEESAQRRAERKEIPIVTLNGAGTVEGKRYLKTGCFAAEQVILHHVKLEAQQRGISVHLQYSLHPAHIKSGEANSIRDALTVEGIEVTEDSFKTWLESDLCISIFSSASWDALALGCDVVFGVSPEDQIYSCGLLSAFSHPSSEIGLIKVLSECISRLPERSNIDPVNRVARAIGSPRDCNI